ncbi:15385_t:CDS:2 [Acaulospora colombiana]|uniref:15385_t:CDS:1 n=1 Tax=Acaulospora colombiana TaxID=27376 RepID=A0ACA9LJE0_9GLOM|nr:15385_t:CDS:2 [Acaulospora colombiana]
MADTSNDSRAQNGVSNATNESAAQQMVLAIGSLGSAKDSTYTDLISSLRSDVDKYMVDRILEGAVEPRPNRYQKAYIVLTSDDYVSLVNSLPQLFEFIAQSLAPSAELRIDGAPPNSNIADILSSNGLTIASQSGSDSQITATKPTSPPTTTSSSLPPQSIALPKRNSAKSQKAAIWSFTTPSTPTIDPSTLLQPSDLARPEAKNSKVVMLNGQVDGEAVVMSQDEKARLLEAAKMASKATTGASEEQAQGTQSIFVKFLLVLCPCILRGVCMFAKHICYQPWNPAWTAIWICIQECTDPKYSTVQCTDGCLIFRVIAGSAECQIEYFMRVSLALGNGSGTYVAAVSRTDIFSSSKHLQTTFKSMSILWYS